MTAWTTADMPDQRGRTAVVTGANSGIGYYAALGLARCGARVFLGCRDERKAEGAAAGIRGAVGSAALVEPLLLDLADLASVRRAAGRLRAGEAVPDLLVNNAGVMGYPERQVTADGFERQFGTNHLGHFALTGLLLPAMLGRAGARVVTITSIAAQRGRIAWDDIQGERRYDPFGAYAQSKLANYLFITELDRRLRAAGRPLLSLGAHPGVSRTSIVDNGPGNRGLRSLLFRFASVMLQSPAAGALPTLRAATAPDAQGGTIYGPNGLAQARGAPVAVTLRRQPADVNAARRLWQLSEDLTGVRFDGLAASPAERAA